MRFRKLEAWPRKEFRAEQLARRALPMPRRSFEFALSWAKATSFNVSRDRGTWQRGFIRHQRRYGYHHSGREIELCFRLRLRCAFCGPAPTAAGLRIKRPFGRDEGGPPESALPNDKRKLERIGEGRIQKIECC